MRLAPDDLRPTDREVRAFYGTADWRYARSVALHRLGKRCCRCGARRLLEVDHIVGVRLSWAARLDPDNLQVLCRRCHRSDKRREERQR